MLREPRKGRCSPLAFHRRLAAGLILVSAIGPLARNSKGGEPTEIVAFGASVLLNRQSAAEPTWVDHLAIDLGIPLHNYAVGGSGVSGAFSQIDNYLANNDVSEKTLFVLWPGPRPYLAPDTPTANDFDYVTLEEKVGEMVERLVDAGARHLFVPEMHWGFTPHALVSHPGQLDTWIGLMTDYNNRQQARLDAFTSEQGVEFIRPGWFELHQTASDFPEDLGFTDGTTPGQNSSFPELHVYWDCCHQSTAFHRLLADDAYLAIAGEPTRTSAKLKAAGGTLLETFDGALGIDDRATGQPIPDGWSTSGPQRLIPQTKVSRAFNRGRIGRALGNGEVFNAGEHDDEDRALATSLSPADTSLLSTTNLNYSEIEFLVDLVDSHPKAARFSFDLEAWGVERSVKEPGRVGFDLTAVGYAEGTSVDVLLDTVFTTDVSKDVTPPPAGETVNGNETAYRSHFDSGVIDMRNVQIDEIRFHWSTVGGWGSEGWVFGLDNFTLHTAFDGDANVDGNVDFADFLILSSKFGKPGTWEDSDFDQNGEVQFADFLLLAQNFGSPNLGAENLGHDPGTIAGVPEASGFTSVLLGCLLCVYSSRSLLLKRRSSSGLPPSFYRVQESG